MNLLYRMICLGFFIFWLDTAAAINEPIYHLCAALWLAALIILLDKDTPRNV
jgi:hypothetical protein